jgi:hypothetical protein
MGDLAPARHNPERGIMNVLVADRPCPVYWLVERLRRWHPNEVAGHVVVGLVAADPQVGSDGADQGLGLRQDQVGVDGRRLGGDAVWQVLALFNVEHGETLEEWDRARRLAPLMGALALVVGYKAVGIDACRAALALAPPSARVCLKVSQLWTE